MYSSTKRLSMIRRNHAENIKDCRKGIAKFCDELKNDPYRAFEWGTGPVATAANLRVSQQVVALIDTMPKSGENALSPDDRVRKLHEVMSREAMNRARFVPASSSAVSNIAEQYLCAAYADAAQDLEWAVSSLDEEE